MPVSLAPPLISQAEGLALARYLAERLSARLRLFTVGSSHAMVELTPACRGEGYHPDVCAHAGAGTCPNGLSCPRIHTVP